MIAAEKNIHLESNLTMPAIRILIIESQMLVREGIGMILKNAGMEIVGLAGSFHEALQKIDQGNPDIVLIDVSLKDINPIELLPIILRRNSRTKVIFLGDGITRQALADGISAGLHGYLHKESDQYTLIKAIMEIYHGATFFTRDATNLIFEEFYRAAATPEKAEINGRHMLTTREQQILAAISKGLKNNEIAANLMISVKTVEVHKTSIKKKLGAKTTTEAMLFAIRKGIIAMS
jgi:DNA-binding NarL/FixJ family response regulator